MNKILLHSFLFILSSAFLLPAQAEISTLSSAINKAGRQRMLSQRILKNHALLGAAVDTLKARQEMSDAISLFDQQLSELKTYAPDANIKKALAKVSELWPDYKRNVQQPPTKAHAMSLLDDSDELLRACHKVVLMLEDLSKTQAGHLVNIAGRQRMLSQRLSKLYIYQAWGFNNATIRSQMNQAKNEFIGALQEMKTAPVNNDKINRKLRAANQQWKLFKHGLDGVEKKPIPYIVNLTGNKLLKTMNELTHLYETVDK